MLLSHLIVLINNAHQRSNRTDIGDVSHERSHAFSAVVIVRPELFQDIPLWCAVKLTSFRVKRTHSIAG